MKKKTKGYQPESNGLIGAVPPNTGSHVRANFSSVELKAEAEHWCPYVDGPSVKHCVHDKEACRDCPTLKGKLKKFQEATAVELKLPKDMLFPEKDVFEKPAADNVWDSLSEDKDKYNDIIGHPNHYCQGRKYEPKDVIRDWELNFNLGNAVKYISRNGRKEGNSSLQDLKKARQYLDFEIAYLENN